MLMAARDGDVERFFVFVLRLCLCSREAGDSRSAGLERDRRLPCNAGRRIWLEKAVQRTDVAVIFMEDFGIETRVARYHNVDGPRGPGLGVERRHPQPFCRKVAEAMQTDSGNIDIWGDGLQTRSSMYVDDCVRGR